MLHTRSMKRGLVSSLLLGPILVLAAMLAPGIAAAAGPISASPACTRVATTVTCELWAKTGTLTLPGTTSPIWGYAASSVGAAGVPGPVIIANDGDTVNVTLHNTLAVTTSILFQGQPMVPDLTGVAAGGTKAYAFTAGDPGTYLYEAGLLPGSQYQVAKGLYGALIVRPAGGVLQANDDPATAFDDEALVVLGEVDTTLNGLTAPAAFDLRAYAPRYFLVNGQAYPQTTPITTTGGNRLLLRYLDAGLQHHSMGVLGLRQTIVTEDGSALASPRRVVAESMAPGQGMDALVQVPTSTALSTKYSLYDASFSLNNTTGTGTNAGIGGMFVVIDAAGVAPGTDTVGPISGGVTISASTGALSASISDASTGGSSVAGAEYFIDTLGTAGSGTAMAGAFPGDPVTATATVAIAPLSSGSHIVYVRGRDSLGNWGAAASATFSKDTSGPIVSGVTATPSSTNGTVSVALAATADDRTSGGANIAAAEYRIDGGSAVAMSLSTTSAPVASLTGSISAATVNGLSAGPHTISVRARDALTNWGAWTDGTLTVDKTGPVTSGVTATPNPSNAVVGVNSTNPSVRIRATMTDTSPSTVVTGEVWIDSVGSPGAGIPMTPTDGQFGSVSEAGFADVPLSTISQLSNGNHTVYVRGKDSAGNWGPTATTILVIDRTAPTFSSITLTPNAIFTGAASVNLTVNGATDGTGTGVAGGEWWIGTTDINPGTGTQFSGTSTSVATASLTPGTYTVRVRIRDAAQNWSTGTNGVRTATLTVANEAIFANDFPNTTLPGSWTSRSTTSTTNLSVTTAAALQGAYGLRARGTGTYYLQYNFGGSTSPAAPIFDGKFLFRSNSKPSSGQDIFMAASNTNYSNGNQLIRVRYRLNGSTPQVQLQVGSSNANTAWTSITAGSTAINTIEVVREAVGSGGASPGTVKLFVNGSLAQSLTTTSSASVSTFRLGSVTSNNSSTTYLYFDAFTSKRSATPYGP